MWMCQCNFSSDDSGQGPKPQDATGELSARDPTIVVTPWPPLGGSGMGLGGVLGPLVQSAHEAERLACGSSPSSGTASASPTLFSVHSIHLDRCSSWTTRACASCRPAARCQTSWPRASPVSGCPNPRLPSWDQSVGSPEIVQDFQECSFLYRQP